MHQLAVIFSGSFLCGARATPHSVTVRTQAPFNTCFKDEQGILTTAQCAVVPCEMSMSHKGRHTVTEAADFLTATERWHA